jgi:general stress protein 26
MSYKNDFAAYVTRMFEKSGSHQIMALASSLNDHVTVRNVSCIMYDHRIFFKTDMNFRKTKQLLENPRVALCFGGIQIEGYAVNRGKVIDEPGRVFEKLYKQYWEKSYNAYPHEDSEILIEIIPKFVEIWDQDSDNKGFQVSLDCDTQRVSLEYYDE